MGHTTQKGSRASVGGGHLEALWALVPPGSHVVESSTKTVITRSFPELSELVLVPLFDVHVGMAQSRMDLFEEVCAAVLSIPNAYVILGGDLMEAATKDSPGNAVFAQTKGIQEQADYLQDLLTPLAHSQRILVGIPGNHERRLTRSNDYDPMATIAKSLGFPYEIGGQAYIHLLVGSQRYTIFAYHGKGSAATIPARVNKALALRSIFPDAHLYLTGHTHQPFTVKVAWPRLHPDGRMVMQYQYLVSVPSFVEYFGSYAEEEASFPVPTGFGYITLSGHAERVTIVQ